MPQPGPAARPAPPERPLFLSADVRLRELPAELALLLQEQEDQLREVESGFSAYRLSRPSLENATPQPALTSPPREAMGIAGRRRRGAVSAADLLAALPAGGSGQWLQSLPDAMRSVVQPTARQRSRSVRAAAGGAVAAALRGPAGVQGPEHADAELCGLVPEWASRHTPFPAGGPTAALHLAAALSTAPARAFELADQRRRCGGVLRPYAALWASAGGRGGSFWQWLDETEEGRCAWLLQAPRHIVDEMVIARVPEAALRLFEVDVHDGQMRWTCDGTLVDMPYSTSADDPPRTPREQQLRDEILDPCLRRHRQMAELFRSAHAAAVDAHVRAFDWEFQSEAVLSPLLQAGWRPSTPLNGWAELAEAVSRELPTQWPGGPYRAKGMFCLSPCGRLYMAHKVRGFFQSTSLCESPAAAGGVRVRRGVLEGVAPYQGYGAPDCAALRALLADWQDRGVDLASAEVT